MSLTTVLVIRREVEIWRFTLDDGDGGAVVLCGTSGKYSTRQSNGPR
jgi:hypothetical protein